MAGQVDLHCHTTASDGMLTPDRVFAMAKQQGLKALAVTDHDTLSGWAKATEASQRWGVEFIPGVEMSTVQDDQDVHVLGYYVDDRHALFLKKLDEMRHVRKRRNVLMVEKLQGLGIAITMEEVEAKKQDRAPDSNIGRPHMAEVLVEKGVVNTMAEAFERYLGRGGQAYCQLPRINPGEAIAWIRAAGGVAVLAHPGLNDCNHWIPEWVSRGLQGLEVHHPDHDHAMRERYETLAEQYGLIKTAGSDFHGKRQNAVYHSPLGSHTVPYDVVTQIKSLIKV